MSLLAPLGLLALAAIPVLMWLWRLSATRRQIQVPSLVPFEHLLRREARRRSRLVTPLLFWLQLAALIGLALALARPVIWQRRTKTILAVLDTSASMEASSAFKRARRALAGRLAAKAPADQVLLMTTSPLAALTPQPTSDPALLAQALDAAAVSHAPGDLGAAVRIGYALSPSPPDRVLVATDETAPAALDGRVQWLGVGDPAPNVAIVGVEAQGTLCTPSDRRAIVTIHNFSNEATQSMVAAYQDGRRLAEAAVMLPAASRSALSLPLPETASGWIEVRLAGSDALATDNRAWMHVRHDAATPIVLQAVSPAITRTVTAWLAACEALGFRSDAAPGAGPYLMITDQEPQESPEPAALLRFEPPAASRPVRSFWVASAEHPIGSYLSPVELVAAPINLSAEPAASGVAAISALVDGRRVPVAIADERDGYRQVRLRFDPAGSEQVTPVALAFFNSLRWLLGGDEVSTTGDMLMVGGFKPGRVTVRRPDGGADTLEADGPLIAYSRTARAGRYEFTQGTLTVVRAVNFLNPLESNLMDQASTWRPLPEAPEPPSAPQPSAHPLTSLLLVIALGVLLAEWWRYAAKGRAMPRAAERPPGGAPQPVEELAAR